MNEKQILNEFNLGSFKNSFKRMNDEEKENVLKGLLSRSLGSMRDKLSKMSKGKNARHIIESKGDITKYRGYDDLIYVITFLRRRRASDNKVTSDYQRTLTLIETTINFLESERNNFKKAFSTRDDMIQILYISAVSSVSILSLKMFTDYFDTERDDSGGNGLAMVYENKRLYETLEAVTLLNINNEYKNGKLSKILSKHIELTNEEDNRSLNEFDGFFLNASDLPLKENAFLKGIEYISRNNAGMGIASIVAIISVIVMIRPLFYKFLEMRVILADYLRDSSRIIEETSNNNTDRVRDRQDKAAKVFRNLADKIDLDDNVSTNKGQNEIETDDRDINNDIKDIQFDF